MPISEAEAFGPTRSAKRKKAAIGGIIDMTRMYDI